MMVRRFLSGVMGAQGVVLLAGLGYERDLVIPLLDDELPDVSAELG